jgi:hypothetical protein
MSLKDAVHILVIVCAGVLLIGIVSWLATEHFTTLFSR